MDRFTNQDGSNFQPQVVTLDIKFTAGTSGAVPTDITGYTVASGIEDMVLSGTGLYTVNLSDTYFRLLGGKFSVIQATYDASHGQEGYIVVDSADLGTPLVSFQCTRPDTGAAVAVTAGDVVCIQLRLQRATGDYE